MKEIEVAVLCCPSLISLMVSVDIKQNLKTNEGRTVQTEQQYRAVYDLVFFPVLNTSQILKQVEMTTAQQLYVCL